MDETFLISLTTICNDDMSLSAGRDKTSLRRSPSNVEIPEEFICPISLQPMVQPLTTRSGLNFERSAILNWLQLGSGLCPLTRCPLRPSDLIPNRQLESKIRIWRSQNQIPQPTCGDNGFSEVSFLGFLPVGETKSKELVLRHETSMPITMNLRDAARAELRASQRRTINTASARSRASHPARIRPTPSDHPSMDRNSKEGRRNFLKRILKQTADNLDGI